jgi:hypothetical protein
VQGACFGARRTARCGESPRSDGVRAVLAQSINAPRKRAAGGPFVYLQAPSTAVTIAAMADVILAIQRSDVLLGVLIGFSLALIAWRLR